MLVGIEVDEMVHVDANPFFSRNTWSCNHFFGLNSSFCALLIDQLKYCCLFYCLVARMVCDEGVLGKNVVFDSFLLDIHWTEDEMVVLSIVAGGPRLMQVVVETCFPDLIQLKNQ